MGTIDGPYAETLVDLYARKHAIEKAIESLEAIHGWLSAPKPTEGSLAEAMGSQQSMMQAIVKVLRQHGGLMSPSDIIAALDESGFEIGGNDKHRNVGATLNRGKNTGVFINPERGQWGLAERTKGGLSSARGLAHRAGNDGITEPFDPFTPPREIPVVPAAAVKRG